MNQFFFFFKVYLSTMTNSRLCTLEFKKSGGEVGLVAGAKRGGMKKGECVNEKKKI